MAPLGLVGQIYVVSAAIGSIYLAIGVALGQAHGTGHGNVGAGTHGLGHGLTHGLSHGTSQAMPHGSPQSLPHALPHGTPHSSASAHETQVHAGQDSAGHIAHPSDTTSHSVMHPHLPSAPRAQTSDSNFTQIVSPTRVNLLRFVLSSLSPFSLSVFLTFFGISGLFIYFFMPVLGFWTMPAATVISFVITRQVLFALSWMVAKMQVSSEAKMEDIIGQIATVCLSIAPGHTGEVTYVVGQSLYNSPAKANDNKSIFKKGSNVVICDLRDNVVLVEPLSDAEIISAEPATPPQRLSDAITTADELEKEK